MLIVYETMQEINSISMTLEKINKLYFSHSLLFKERGLLL